MNILKQKNIFLLAKIFKCGLIKFDDLVKEGGDLILPSSTFGCLEHPSRVYIFKMLLKYELSNTVQYQKHIEKIGTVDLRK
jgi:hypothetical protein